jgi:hypothetical protein
MAVLIHRLHTLLADETWSQWHSEPCSSRACKRVYGADDTGGGGVHSAERESRHAV